MTESAIAIACGADSLVGILHRGAGRERDIGILVLVGGPQYRVGSHRQFVLMARRWAAAGYPVMRFDYRGMGDSPGEPRSFEDVDLDLRSALDAFFASVSGLSGVVVFGLCDAAAAALMYCRSDPRLSGLMLANPWVRTPEGEARSHVRHYYGSRLLQRSFWQKLLSGELKVFFAVRSLMAAWLLSRRRGSAGSAGQREFFLDRMLEGLIGFEGPVLLLISERDLTAREFEDLCRDDPSWRRASGRPSVSKTTLAGADHTFSTREALEEATEACRHWLEGCTNDRMAS